MLSRVAESLYWMSRYLERAENVARFIDVNYHMCLDIPGEGPDQWKPLVDASGDREAFAERYGEATRENVIRFLTFDTENPNSVTSCVQVARENARWIRQFITLEMWEHLNRFYLMVGDAARNPSAVVDHDFLNQVMTANQLFLGILDGTLSRGEGWHFCRLGRLLERADKSSRMLDVKYFHLLPTVEHVGTPYDDILWAAVLRSMSALEMYRKRHHRIDPGHVVEFLVLDREFPRAIHHCVMMAEESLREISGTPAGTFHNRAEQRLGRLRAEFDYAQVEEILEGGLHEFLDGLQTKLNTLGEAVFESFFARRPVGGEAARGGGESAA
ncbi:MAG: alpha-E domain-containing protein [Deferrisomatales bacterium]|nr:alpha-E domain-containing protein [Deferrisomatales bacterium]